VALDFVKVPKHEPDRLLLPSYAHAHEPSVLLQQFNFTENLAQLFNGSDARILGE
jgi:hypothetical protein